jgi:iron-sulfur cluster assembly accessory protein
MDNNPYSSSVVSITNSAKQYLMETARNNQQKNIWFGVQGGGCSGFSYQWKFVDEPDPNDEEVVLGHTSLNNDQVDVKLIIDSMSELYIIGSTIDYVKDLAGSFLRVDNPMSASSCGCGESFSVNM